jgi:hypothetical protein
VLLKRGKERVEMRVTAGVLGSPKHALEVRCLWTGQRWSITDGVISADIEEHSLAMQWLKQFVRAIVPKHA